MCASCQLVTFIISWSVVLRPAVSYVVYVLAGGISFVSLPNSLLIPLKDPLRACNDPLRTRSAPLGPPSGPNDPSMSPSGPLKGALVLAGTLY